MRASRSRFSWLRDSHIDGFRLSASRSILLLLLCCVEVCMDLPLWPLPPPTPMAARHEARHEFLLVEIIEAGWSTGLTVEVNEVCAWFCVVFLSWNLNIFKLNEYFESRAGTFIFEYVRVSVCSCSQKFIKFFTLPRAALAVILTANRTEISLYLFMFTHGLTHTSQRNYQLYFAVVSHWRRTAYDRFRFRLDSDLAQSVWPITRRRETCLNEISLSVR